MIGVRISFTCAAAANFSTTNNCCEEYGRSKRGWCQPQRRCKFPLRQSRSVPACVVNDGSNSENDAWLKSATPYEILGLSNDSNAEEIKTAFRERVKIYHPDVYKGDGDSQDMMLRLIKAYEVLGGSSSSKEYLRRSASNPFTEPEEAANSVFVNELRCRGPSCSESCVTKCPQTFHFSESTNRARAHGSGADEYALFLAVGQCPERCIHYVTSDQKYFLEEQLQRGIDGVDSMEAIAAILESLLARANFENGRSRGKARKGRTSDEWVDWF